MDGMTAGEIAWGVIMPEFQGMIEMLPVGALGEGGRQVPIAGRVFRFVARVARWLALARIPPSEKRVAFVLNNGPCAGLEATIGTAAHLDALESLALLLSDSDQYRVEYDSGEAPIRGSPAACSVPADHGRRDRPPGRPSPARPGASMPLVRRELPVRPASRWSGAGANRGRPQDGVRAVSTTAGW